MYEHPRKFINLEEYFEVGLEEDMLIFKLGVAMYELMYLR